VFGFINARSRFPNGRNIWAPRNDALSGCIVTGHSRLYKII